MGAQRPRGLAASSRATEHEHRIPAPQLDENGFVDAVGRAVAQVRYEVVFGARDVDVLALSARREDIGAIVPHPPHERVLRAFDKVELGSAAESVGIAVPATQPASGRAIAEVRLPVIVKARLHAGTGEGARPARLETAVAATRAEVRDAVETMRAAGGDPLIQEHLPGALLEVATLAAPDGRIVGEVHQVAHRTSDRGSGVAVRATTVGPDPVLSARIAALLEELGWWGLAELQFVAPPGAPVRLIDFNGRFYGSLALAVRAGPNLPAMWASMAAGGRVEAAAAARTGVRYHWMHGDVARCIREPTPQGARSLLDAVRYAPGAVHSVFEAADPAPAVRQLTRALRPRARRGEAGPRP